MYSPEEVPSSDNEYQIGDPTGPFPYAPPGPIRYGTYPEPPEGYNQYQYQEGNKIIREDLGTGRYPNVGPGMIPKGYEIPAPPPLRTPERSVTSPTPTPPSMQSAGYDRDYNRYVGHLDPKYSGASFATPHERFSAGAQTGATQKAITDQFMLRRMQQGGEQHDTLESYAMDKFNPIPKMDLIEFQSMMKNDLGIDDPIRASMPTPLAPSVQAMTEEYDATLTPQYGSSGDPYNLTEARQAANLQATGNSMYTPGVYVTPSESSKYSSQELQIAQEEIEKRRIYNEQYPGGMNTPSYSPTSQQIVNDLNTGLVQGLNKVQQEEGGLTGDEEGIDTGTNTVAGTIAGMLGFMGLTSPTANAVNGLMSTITGKPDVLGLNKSTNALLEFATKNYTPPAGMQDDSDSGLGPPAGPDVSHSTGEDISVYGKDGGEVRKYQDGSVGVGSIDPRINPSQGSSSPGMNFINKPGAAPPSKLADDVLIKDEGDVGVREGDVVFPPESVEIMGLLNMNDMIKAALGLALEVGAVVPANIDPNEKVPVRLTNGEVIIPKVVADALGKDRVQEIINKGLKLRAQREEQAQEQQQAPQAAPQAPQAPPQAPQAMPQGLKDGSSSIGKQMDSLLRGKTVDLPGTALDFNVGFDRYNAEDVIAIAKKVGAVLGNATDGTNLLLETAAVESGMGETDRDINRASGEGFTIGPWQVTTTALNDINSRVGVRFHEGMAANIAKFKQYDWAKDIPFGKVTEEDLKDPLINAVYARLYYTLKEGAIPDTPEGRAKYWAKKYNTDKDIHGTPALYMKKFREAKKLGYIK